MAAALYNPNVFRVPDVQSAREIILTTENDATTDRRWEIETPYMVDLIQREIAPAPGSLIIDFGCGIGRLAKLLIERCQCSVLGVDISPDMRALAPHYVESENFSVVSPALFRQMVNNGLRASGAFSVWVIQHCFDPAQDIDLIRQSLSPGAGFALVNSITRVVPVTGANGFWANDGLDIRAMTAEMFLPIHEGQLDAAYVGHTLAGCSFWASYCKS